MAYARTGAQNPNWKGGRSVASNGYVLIRVGVGHHLADVRGYAYEHRLVAERKLGRRLLSGEHAHHRDGDRQNNADDNIEVLTAAEHRREHRHSGARLRDPGEANAAVACACGCGSTLLEFDTSGRLRRFLPAHNNRIRSRDANGRYGG